MDYTLTQTEFRNAKTRLTRVLNAAKRLRVDAFGPLTVAEASAASNAWVNVANECKRAAQLFAAKGFPDSWHRWRIAFEDARCELQREPLRRMSCARILGENPFD